MSIEIATLHDLKRISELVNAAYKGEIPPISSSSKVNRSWTNETEFVGGFRTCETALKEDLEDCKNSVILKYTSLGEIQGCVFLRKVKNENESVNYLYLGMLSVSPEFQGCGIGKQILQSSEEYGIANKCKSVRLTVISQRDSLIDWYKRHGYSDTGRREPFNSKTGIPKSPSIHYLVLEKVF